MCFSSKDGVSSVHYQRQGLKTDKQQRSSLPWRHWPTAWVRCWRVWNCSVSTSDAERRKLRVVGGTCAWVMQRLWSFWRGSTRYECYRCSWTNFSRSDLVLSLLYSLSLEFHRRSRCMSLKHLILHRTVRVPVIHLFDCSDWVCTYEGLLRVMLSVFTSQDKFGPLLFFKFSRSDDGCFVVQCSMSTFDFTTQENIMLFISQSRAFAFMHALFFKFKAITNTYVSSSSWSWSGCSFKLNILLM